MRSVIYVLFAVTLFFCDGILLGQPPNVQIPESRDGTLLFRQGIALSYASQHPEAQEKFKEYQKRHPDDLLVAFRILYDRFFAKKEMKFSDAEYSELLKMADAAIGRYEAKQCSGTDIQSIAGTTLDCDYVAAALYSFRMALVANNDTWRHTGLDRKKFLEHANRSTSPQALFLLGVYEYEISQQRGLYKFLLRRWNIPTDDGHAASTILRSLDNNASPFVDDIWLFIFNVQCANKDAVPAKKFGERFPIEQVFGYLLARYPKNVKIQECPLFKQRKVP